MGSNADGQLGIGDLNIPEKTAPVLIENIQICKPVYITAGAYHSACTMKNGELYTWGRGHKGCLGIDSDQTQSAPILVEFNQTMYPFIVQVTAGNAHTMCRDQQGRIYGFGANGK